MSKSAHISELLDQLPVAEPEIHVPLLFPGPGGSPVTCAGSLGRTTYPTAPISVSGTWGFTTPILA